MTPEPPEHAGGVEERGVGEQALQPLELGDRHPEPLLEPQLGPDPRPPEAGLADGVREHRDAVGQEPVPGPDGGHRAHRLGLRHLVRREQEDRLPVARQQEPHRPRLAQPEAGVVPAQVAVVRLRGDEQRVEPGGAQRLAGPAPARLVLASRELGGHDAEPTVEHWRELLLVRRDAESRALRQNDPATVVDVGRRRGVVHDAVPPVELRVLRGRGQRQVRRRDGGQRPLVHLAHEARQPGRLGERQELPGAVEAARLHQLDVEHAHRAEPDQRHRVLQGEEALVGHERERDRLLDLGQAGDVVGRHRLLDGLDPELLQGPDPPDRLLGAPRLVRVHREPHGVADRLADGAHPLDVEAEGLETHPDLDDPEPLGDEAPRLGGRAIGGPVEHALRAEQFRQAPAAQPADEGDAGGPGREVVPGDVEGRLGGVVADDRPVARLERRAPLPERAADDQGDEDVAQRGDDPRRALAREVAHVPAHLAPAGQPVLAGQPDVHLLQRGHPAGEVGEAAVEAERGGEDVDPADLHFTISGPFPRRRGRGRSPPARRPR